MNDYIVVQISSSNTEKEFSSWLELIKENFGSLSGYASDLKEGKSINIILLDILKLNNNINYLNIRGIYLNHIKSLQNLDNKNIILNQEIQVLEGDSPSMKVVDILLKYGILSGIEFQIPSDKNIKYYNDIMGNDVFVKRDYKDIFSQYYEGIIVDGNYISEKKPSFKHKDLRLAAQVIIYSKTKSKAYDVTKFLSNISISVSKETGGNFRLKMHLISIKDLEKNNAFGNNNIDITGYTKALFLQSIFRENDLVFIRFEKLKAENFDNNKKIKGKYWDMIGLIDNNVISSDYNSMELSISGRDLIKLFIEDNNFFIPYQFGNSPETIFGGKSTKIFKRLFSTGEYNLEFMRSFKSIQNSLGFIFSQLTNIEILSENCIDFLLEEYGYENLSKQFEYKENGKEEKIEVIRGIWGIVNFAVDGKIANYRLADSSLRSPNGSILQQILKICQHPFVELICDTFVDKYTIIARRPPFTIEDIYNSKFIVVDRESSIRDDLKFSNEVYTIYQLNPQGGCLANSSSIALSYLPMVVLDEYTKLWGSKLYNQTYNYIDIDAYNKMTEEGQKSIKENFIEDLIWLIETTAYLPFSRTGTIVTKGDRRIKAGQWIYYEKTNEVFYVNAVNHSVNIVNGSVDRKTTLEVSRGLVKNYIIPPKRRKISDKIGSSDKDIQEVKVFNMSYGDIIDIESLRVGLKEMTLKMNKKFNLGRQIKKGDSIYSTTSLVIDEVFKFFLSGKQFEGQVNPYSLYYDNAALSLREIEQKQNEIKGTGYEMTLEINNIENPIPDDLLENGGNGGSSNTIDDLPLQKPVILKEKENNSGNGNVIIFNPHLG